MKWIRIGLLAFATLSVWLIHGVVIHSLSSQAAQAHPGLLQNRLVDRTIDEQGSRSTPQGDAHGSAQVTDAIHAAAEYLVRHTGDDGKFVYRRDARSGHELLPRYNLVRHAGAIYALAKYQAWQPSESVSHAMVNSARFLRREAIRCVPGHDGLLAVWSDPAITHDDDRLEAKLGGAGLGLAALVSVENCQPGVTSIDDLRQLAQFICFMQKEDGSFYSKYLPADGGRSDAWTSLYYPGEAALGLLMLYERDPSPVWLDAAASALGYLARSRSGQRQVEADHWALLATARLLALDDDTSRQVSRQQLVYHAKQICESILADRPNVSDNPLEFGGFSADGRTCPTATRLEGLIVAHDFLARDEDRLRARIESSIHQGLDFLLRSQLHGGALDGGMPRAMLPMTANHLIDEMAGNERDTEIRIDYVQHAMCAMLDYLQLGMERDRHVDRSAR